MKKGFGFGEMIIFLLRIYKRCLSPLMPPLCRFQPTCSEYMIDAIRKQGAVKGLIMGCARIIRCNPFCEGGYDPVPENFTLHRNNKKKDKIIK